MSTLVIDLGTQFIKAGLSNGPVPTYVLRGIVGRPKTPPGTTYVGDAAISHEAVLNLSFPLETGVVSNWDDAMLLFNKIYADFELSSEEQPVFFTYPCATPVSFREDLVTKMFEEYNVPAFFVANQPLLGMYAAMQGFTGVYIDVGHTKTQVASVVDGYTLPHTASLNNYGGNTSTLLMKNSLVARLGPSNFTTFAQVDVVRNMKETLSYVAADYDVEVKADNANPSVRERTYTMPDSSTITILGRERFDAGEVPFQPSTVGGVTSAEDVASLAYNSIQAVDEKERHNLWANVVLSGGASLCPGMVARLQSSLQLMAGPSYQVNIRVPNNFANLKNLTWMGAAALAESNDMSGHWVSREDYDEQGSNVVNTKCL